MLTSSKFYDDPAEILGSEAGVDSDRCYRLDLVPGGHQWLTWGVCERSELRSEACEGSKAVAIDGSGYYAVLRTQADFGCAQWEPEVQFHTDFHRETQC